MSPPSRLVLLLRLPCPWLWPQACALPFLSASASESSPEEDDDDDDSSLDSSAAFGLWYMQHTLGGAVCQFGPRGCKAGGMVSYLWSFCDRDLRCRRRPRPTGPIARLYSSRRAGAGPCVVLLPGAAARPPLVRWSSVTVSASRAAVDFVTLPDGVSYVFEASVTEEQIRMSMAEVGNE